METRPNNHADDSQVVNGSGSNVRVGPFFPDRTLLIVIGLVLSIAFGFSFALGGIALFISDRAEREARMSEYYAIDLEQCLLKGICPNPKGKPIPADLWHKGDRK